MLDLDTLPESQATSIAAFGGPVSQQLLDTTAPIEDGEEYIWYLHEEVLEDAQEAEERAAAKRAPKRKRLNERLTEEEAIEIAPHADLPFEVPAGVYGIYVMLRGYCICICLNEAPKGKFY